MTSVAAVTYQRWAAGYCPCCGTDDWEPWLDGTEPLAIGEGVRVCGRCVAKNHLDPPGFIVALLEAIALRDERPIDELIEKAGKR